MTKRLITEFFETRTNLPLKKPALDHSPTNITITSDEPKPSYSENIKNLMGDEWFDVLNSEINKPYFKSLWSRVLTERNSKRVYPPAHLVFNAFKLTPLSKIKVVIVGQDPYHQPKQAMGLCFSVPRGVMLPPSLRNILSEIGTKSFHGDLSSWASQGVFLLNSILTVVDSQPMSHKLYGWDTFTDQVINIINDTRENVVFLLWGRSAQQKCSKISNSKHYVLTCGHPSPLSIKHFKGCNHFNKCNDYLEKTKQDPINWELPQ
ncbi:uracil-DNA glycosylase [Theileria orientalis]|uniref:Uracil-DNA glycosylase n=1 Tax=Theileria orientalis TaxID=68886 RepID=A0A976MD29_THEOR|nr:uracil-DNA glycosylase [Theileria orientalis]